MTSAIIEAIETTQEVYNVLNEVVEENYDIEFELEKLETLSPVPEGEGITFVQWMILDKSEVISHKMARELNIFCQTRVGQALFLDEIRDIEEDVIENGWQYRCAQPAVSKLENPIMGTDGKMKYYIVRDGNNRFEMKFSKYPCALIEGNEYDLLRYGATSNNPSAYEKKRSNTKDDVKAMISIGIDRGVIEGTLEAVVEELRKNYPYTQKKNRHQFAAEILSKNNIKLSIEYWDQSRAKKFLESEFDIQEGLDDTIYRGVVGWGRDSNDIPQMLKYLKMAADNPTYKQEIYSFLLMGAGVHEQPDENNIPALRERYEQKFRKFVREDLIPIVDSYRNGNLSMPSFHWFAQINNKERHDQFH